jgi:hypothetical protein
MRFGGAKKLNRKSGNERPFHAFLYPIAGLRSPV